MLPKPYYHDEEAGITIYCGDCREILPHLSEVDLVLTDPPYPDAFVEQFCYGPHVSEVLERLGGKQYVFWSAIADFPLSYTGIHIWNKRILGGLYERCFVRHGSTSSKIFTHSAINSDVTAGYVRDVYTGHPTQKPRLLIEELLTLEPDAQTILDPFMGSGTTLVAAKQLGRKAIGIELEEKYCAIAVQRLAQNVLPLAV